MIPILLGNYDIIVYTTEHIDKEYERNNNTTTDNIKCTEYDACRAHLYTCS